MLMRMTFLFVLNVSFRVSFFMNHICVECCEKAGPKTETSHISL